MSFFVLAILVLIAIILLQIYFVHKVGKTIKIFFEKISDRKIRYFKIAWLILINLLPIYVIISRFYSALANESITPPEGMLIDYLFIYPFWIFVMLVVQIMLFVIPVETVKLFFLKHYRRSKEKYLRWEARYMALLIGVFIIYVPARIIYDHQNVETRIIEYKKENLPKALNGFKIGLISDVQADRYTDKERLNRFISELNASEPDIVLIAGDIITSTPNYIKTAAEALSNIRSVHGTYSCVGDHDNWAYRGDSERSLREITMALDTVGIPMIDNDRISLNIDSAKVGIAFITDNYVNRVSRQFIDSLANGNEHYDIKILLTHQPNQYMVDAAKENGYNIFLAGHTHGGQITFIFPFFQPSVTHIETKYVKGDFWFDDMLMYVTPGLGMSLAPIRYNSTPEITIIKLTR